MSTKHYAVIGHPIGHTTVSYTHLTLPYICAFS